MSLNEAFMRMSILRPAPSEGGLMSQSMGMVMVPPLSS